MLGKKKIIAVALVTAAVAAVSIGGVVLARGGEPSNYGNAAREVTANITQPQSMLARVAKILGIDQAKLEAAFKQAESEKQLEDLKTRLNALVQRGAITQAQADDYLKWYQSKPDMAPFQQQLKEWMQNKPAVPPALKDWQQSKPNVPLPGGMGGGRGFRMPGHGGGFGMRQGFVVPQGLPLN